MGMMLGLGTAIVAPGAKGDGSGQPAPGGPVDTISVTPFPQNPVVFDSGAARGANAATVPLSGFTSAPNGTPIEARVVRDDTGASVRNWQVIGTAAGGAWTGNLTDLPRAPHRLRVDVRLPGGSAVASMATGFFVGHVVAIIGQSEDDRMFKESSDEPAYQSRPALVDDDAVFVLRSAPQFGRLYSDDGVEPVTSANPPTSALAHFADVWTRNAPGEKILFVDGTVSGTNREDLVDAPTATGDSRAWGPSFFDAVDMVRDWGSDIGVVIDTWTAADSLPNTSFRTKFSPFYTGLEADGSAYALGTASTGFGNPVWPKVLWDLGGANAGSPDVAFDPAVTKLAFHGPHRFEDNNPSQPYLRSDKQDTRMSIRAMGDDPLWAPIMRPKGPEILLYQNGERSITTPNLTYDPAGPHWSDYSHPSNFTDDGLPARARHTAVAVMYALGIGAAPAVDHWVPRFNRSFWQAQGNYAEFWYEAPDGSPQAVTTTRLHRGEPDIPNSFPHRTEVAGFYIDGAPAEDVTIVNGRVRIRPNAGTFDGNTVVQFGLGGASGVVQWPEDEFDGIWKNLPMVDLGLQGVEGVALEPMPDSAALASPLAATPNFTTAASGPYFMDTGPIGAGVGGLTVAARVRPTILSGARKLASITSFNWNFELLNNGAIRLRLKDDGNTTLLNNVQTNAKLTVGIWADLVVSMDLAAGWARVWVDGVEQTFALGPNSGALASNRTLTALARNDGAEQFVGDVEYMRFWKASTADGATGGLGAPYKAIEGSAATVNGDPWKRGADGL